EQVCVQPTRNLRVTHAKLVVSGEECGFTHFLHGLRKLYKNMGFQFSHLFRDEVSSFAPLHHPFVVHGKNGEHLPRGKIELGRTSVYYTHRLLLSYYAYLCTLPKGEAVF